MSICSNCGKKEAKNRCTGCKLSYYCNTECQRASWNQHKNECKRKQNQFMTNQQKQQRKQWIELGYFAISFLMLIVWFLLPTRIYLYSILISLCLSFIIAITIYLCCCVSKENRIHWIEFYKHPLCPSVLQEFVNIYRYETSKSMSRQTAVSLEKLADDYKCNIILDLFSDAYAPAAMINKMMNSTRNDSNKIKTVLTHVSPLIDSWKQLSLQNENVLYCKNSIDATSIPAMNQLAIYNNDRQIHINQNEKVIRTLFWGLGDFKADVCIKLLYNAISKGNMVVIHHTNLPKRFLGWMYRNVLAVILCHTDTLYYVMRYWFNQSRYWIFKWVQLIVFWPFLFVALMHDENIIAARMYSREQVRNMANSAANKANKECRFEVYPLDTTRSRYLCVVIP